MAKPEELEERKVVALEKIANTLDALTLWFDDIDTEEWQSRIEYYLAVYFKLAQPKDTSKEDE